MPRTTPPSALDTGRLSEAEANTASRAIALVDATARVRAVSAVFASVLRIRRDELLGRPLSGVARVADRPALLHAIQAVGSGEWPGCSLEIAVEQHARSPRAIRFVLEPDGAGRVLLTASDLSAEREAQRSREEYEQSLRALTQHSLDIWALVGAQGVVRSMSDSVAVHLGWLPNELEGRPLGEILADEDVVRLQELLDELAAEPQAVRSVVARARHREGGWRTLEATVSGLMPTLLGHQVFVLNARDVTARERTEAALREVEHRFSRLVEQALTGIAVVQQGRIVYANPRFLDLAGFAPGGLTERPRVLSLLDRSALPALRDLRTELATGSRQASRVQLMGRRRDGAPIEVEVATSVVEFEGRPALLCTVSDMTDARALQRRMSEAEKVEAVGVLAGGVAHDFNNLLTGILAWVDIATDDVDPLGPVATALFEIRVSAERAAELTRQLLAFGRRQLLDPRPLDLGEAAVRLKRWMDRALGANHRLIVTVPDETWAIRADRTEIERAITALVMNAQDAMPTGGEILLTVANESLTTADADALGSVRAGDHVVVTVSDTGIGMDEPTRRRIFDPFFTTKPQGSGTGLGLAAVQGTVLQLGGAIEVVTSPGKGATFRLHFPRLVDTAPAAAGPSREPLARQRVPRSVLVVEDDVQLGRILRRILLQGGHTVRLATSAAEAEALAAVPSDVLVCDVELPGRNGADLAAALRARGACGATILISGRPILDDEIARAGRATVRLQKPFRPQSLLDAVDDVMRLAPTG